MTMSLVERDKLAHLAEQGLQVLDDNVDARAAATAGIEEGFFEGLRSLFQDALDSDADLVVIIARRALILFHLFRVAGLLDLSNADLTGRVVSQRTL